MERIVVTGMGVVCANGDNRETFGEACLKGQVGIRECRTFDTTGLSTPCFGEACDKYILDTADYDPETMTHNRFYDMLTASLQDMLADAGLTAKELGAMGRRCRLLMGTFLYYNEAFALHWKATRGGHKNNFLALVNDYSNLAREISGVRGPVTVATAACASSAGAVGMAMDYLRGGICDTAVVVGIDSLNPGHAYGFQALKLLSGGVCNPYDENRDGINIGEGSAALLLETMTHARKRKAKIYGELAGYALGNDAYHIISPEPTGESACQVMQKALEDAGITISDVDYINGHGTGTQANDTMELKAIEKLLGDADKEIWVSSTKAMVGHCMGAAGAVELASVLLSMKRQQYIPLPNLKNPISHDDRIHMAAESCPLKMNYALSNSFAFAGNTAVLVVKNCEEGDSQCQ